MLELELSAAYTRPGAAPGIIEPVDAGLGWHPAATVSPDGVGRDNRAELIGEVRRIAFLAVGLGDEQHAAAARTTRHQMLRALKDEVP